jgi:membrane protease YdiL (CAAX protease family)
LTLEKEDKQMDVAVRDKTLAAWEIASVTLSFLLAEWMIQPFAANSRLVNAIPLALALALMLLSHHARRETAREIGWRIDNFISALRLLILPMIGLGTLILVVGWFGRSLRAEKLQVWQWVVWLFVWGLIQQYVLQGFINRRAQILWGSGVRSILLVALVFALLHLPNPWLSVATFIGGAVWAAVYQRVPNLPALALSHGLMSLLLASSFPASAINSLRVGIRYFG